MNSTFDLGNHGEALVRYGLSQMFRDIRETPKILQEQLVWGDLVVPGVAALGLKHQRIEVKTEAVQSPNLFWEWWSNKDLKRPGWGQSTPADAMYYLFWDSGKGYRLPNVQTLKWLIDYYKGDFKYVQQKKHNQPNETWGYLVPVEWLIESNEAIPFDFNRLRDEWSAQLEK